MVAINWNNFSKLSPVNRNYHHPRLRLVGDWKSLKKCTWFIVMIILVLILLFDFFIPVTGGLFPSLGSGAQNEQKQEQSENSCRYHGNCRVGTTCWNGTCIPYYSEGTNVRSPLGEKSLDKCVKECLSELTVDEGYFYGSMPIVQSTHSAWNGYGCLIKYKRQRRTEKLESRPSIDEWLQGRLRRVVRVDPIISGDLKDVDLWMGVCNLPCENNADCPVGLKCIGRTETAFIPPGIKSTPKSCQQEPNQEFAHDMVIVSGSDRAYFSGLENLAASLLFWSPERRLVVYNLGMTQSQLAEVKTWPNVYEVHWPDGIPKSYPSHIQHLKNYAWKSIAIHESVRLYKSIFWLDAGATFTGPVDAIEEIVHRHGLFLVKGQDDDMKYRSHPDTYKWFGYDKSTYSTGPHWAGGIQGHVFPSRYIDTIVDPNAKCALDPKCISPEGSHVQNHRFDQTSLSILGYQPHVQAPSYTELLAADRSQLPTDLGDKQSFRQFIFWTSRRHCTFYSYKPGLLPSSGAKKRPWDYGDWER